MTNKEPQELKINEEEEEDKQQYYVNQIDQESTKPLPSAQDPNEVVKQLNSKHHNLVQVDRESTHSLEGPGEEENTHRSSEFDSQTKRDHHKKPSHKKDEHEIKSDKAVEQQLLIEDLLKNQRKRRPSSPQNKIEEKHLENLNNNQDSNSDSNSNFTKHLLISSIAAGAVIGLSKAVVKNEGISLILGIGTFVIGLMLQK